MPPCESDFQSRKVPGEQAVPTMQCLVSCAKWAPIKQVIQTLDWTDNWVLKTATCWFVHVFVCHVIFVGVTLNMALIANILVTWGC